MRCTKRTPIDDDAENAVIRPLEACVSLSTEGTNDVDTLRQLISQSLPQLLNSCVSFLSTFISMLVLDIPLTYQKDMIVYNTDKISGYTFTGTPYFFDILSLEPAE